MENIHEDTVSKKYYDEMAKFYENFVDTKAWNAYYERPAVISLLPKEIKKIKIMDLGCAGGWYTKYLLDNGSDVMAIDVNENMIEVTKTRTQNQCKVIQADIINGFDFIENGHFDIILASLVLHYIKELNKAFNEINRVLKMKIRLWLKVVAYAGIIKSRAYFYTGSRYVLYYSDRDK